MAAEFGEWNAGVFSHGPIRCRETAHHVFRQRMRKVKMGARLPPSRQCAMILSRMAGITLSFRSGRRAVPTNAIGVESGGGYAKLRTGHVASRALARKRLARDA